MEKKNVAPIAVEVGGLDEALKKIHQLVEELEAANYQANLLTKAIEKFGTKNEVPKTGGTLNWIDEQGIHRTLVME